MRRREFLGLVGSVTAVAPQLVSAQQQREFRPSASFGMRQALRKKAFSIAPCTRGSPPLVTSREKPSRLSNDFRAKLKAVLSASQTSCVALNVDVLVAVSVPSILAAQKATKTIPIVFVPPQDPITLKLTTSLAKPTGNLTGLTTMGVDVAPKRVQLLKTAFPDLSSVGMLFDPVVAYNVVREVEDTKQAATSLGMSFEALETHLWEDVEPAFQKLADHHMAAVIVAQGPMFFIERHRIAQLAIDRKLPMMGASDVFADGGFLMSYGADWPTLFKAVPSFVDKLLKGAKPADLPIQQPTSFEFILNMKTAEMCGLQIPQTAQLLATRVIE